MDTTTHSRASRGRSWLGALLMASLGHSPIAHAAVAESDRIAALEQKLDQSLQLIRQLSARVQALEAQPQTAQSPGAAGVRRVAAAAFAPPDRKSTRLNSSHRCISYAVFCLKKKI